MTTRHVRPSVDEQQVLVVALCGGSRCAGLHRMRASGGESGDGLASTDDDRSRAARVDASIGDVCGSRIRAAVRERSDAVLMTVTCPGLCHLGGVVAVGWADSGERRLDWQGRPVLLARVEEPDRNVALADWVRSGAPDVKQMPAQLR